jgi:hypothetical protein
MRDVTKGFRVRVGGLYRSLEVSVTTWLRYALALLNCVWLET